MRLGNERRQGLLRESQVASLYGEESFRNLVEVQSLSIPLPVPLALGCGYIAGGHWAPARRDFAQHNTAAGRGLRETLASPFLGHGTLGDLRRVMAEEARWARARARATSEQGGFSSLSAAINEATVNGKISPLRYYQKASNTTAAGAAYWAWMWTGIPGAGAIPAAALASTAPVATTAGAFGQANAPSSNTQHLFSATASSTVAAGWLAIVDMTLIVQPVLATLTAQTITGSPTRYQSNGNNGVYPFSVMGAAANATTPTITITYTESTAGTTGHTTGGVVSQASAAAYRTNMANGAIFYPIAAGDIGVRRIETTQQSTTFGTSAMAYGLAYLYGFVPIGAANAIFGSDFLNTQFNPVQVIDGACVTFWLMAATTTSGTIQGDLIMVSGNS